MDRGTKITCVNAVKNKISTRKLGNVSYYIVQSNIFRVLAYLTTHCMVQIYIANGFGRKERLSGGKHFIIYLTLDKNMRTTVNIILTLKSRRYATCRTLTASFPIIRRTFLILYAINSVTKDAGLKDMFR
jgi:hypothetical protein